MGLNAENADDIFSSFLTYKGSVQHLYHSATACICSERRIYIYGFYTQET